MLMKKTIIMLALILNIWNQLCVYTNKLECMKQVTGFYTFMLIDISTNENNSVVLATSEFFLVEVFFQLCWIVDTVLSYE